LYQILFWYQAKVSIVSDDTNVWVNNTTTSYDQKEQEQPDANGGQGNSKSDFVEKRGMKKMQSLMAMVQHVILRASNDFSGPGEIAQVHCPSQLLPRANWKTIHDRMIRWGGYTSQGTAEPLGGIGVWELFKRIPLKLMIHCGALSWRTSLLCKVV
jgi:hypothetical protein